MGPVHRSRKHLHCTRGKAAGSIGNFLGNPPLSNEDQILARKNSQAKRNPRQGAWLCCPDTTVSFLWLWSTAEALLSDKNSTFTNQCFKILIKGYEHKTWLARNPGHVFGYQVAFNASENAFTHNY